MASSQIEINVKAKLSENDSSEIWISKSMARAVSADDGKSPETDRCQVGADVSPASPIVWIISTVAGRSKIKKGSKAVDSVHFHIRWVSLKLWAKFASISIIASVGCPQLYRLSLEGTQEKVRIENFILQILSCRTFFRHSQLNSHRFPKPLLLLSSCVSFLCAYQWMRGWIFCVFVCRRGNIWGFHWNILMIDNLSEFIPREKFSDRKLNSLRKSVLWRCLWNDMHERVVFESGWGRVGVTLQWPWPAAMAGFTRFKNFSVSMKLTSPQNF